MDILQVDRVVEIKGELEWHGGRFPVKRGPTLGLLPCLSAHYLQPIVFRSDFDPVLGDSRQINSQSEGLFCLL